MQTTVSFFPILYGINFRKCSVGIWIETYLIGDLRGAHRLFEGTTTTNDYQGGKARMVTTNKEYWCLVLKRSDNRVGGGVHTRGEDEAKVRLDSEFLVASKDQGSMEVSRKIVWVFRSLKEVVVLDFDDWWRQWMTWRLKVETVREGNGGWVCWFFGWGRVVNQYLVAVVVGLSEVFQRTGFTIIFYGFSPGGCIVGTCRVLWQI